MLVAGDEDRAFSVGEGEQVVVAWVCGPAWWVGRVGGEDGAVAEHANEFGCVLCRDALAELRVGATPTAWS